MLLSFRTILVVDDDAALLDALDLTLTGLGYGVITADDPFAALALLAAPGPIDLLFTDVAMPGTVDGWELARRARLIRPELKVLYMSAYANRLLPGLGDPARGLLLPKPWESWQLPTYIQRLLGDGEAVNAVGEAAAWPRPQRLGEQARRWHVAACHAGDATLKGKLAERARALAEMSASAAQAEDAPEPSAGE